MIIWKYNMKKKIIPIVVLLFLLITLPVSFFVVKQQQDIRQKAAPATTMSFTPSEKTVSIGETFSLDITINTGENNIIATSMHIIFDSAKLEAQSIINSPQFPNILSSADTSQPGKASIAVGTASISKPFKGTGIVGTIRFRVLQGSNTPIRVSFGPETFVGSLGEGSRNALIGTSPATIIISSNPSQISPTRIPAQSSPTQLPTPTQRANQTPTRIPTGTQTITPTPIRLQQSSTPIPTNSPGAGLIQLILSSPKNGSSITQDPPTLSGKAPPGSTITILLNPGSVTGAVTTNNTGNWLFKPNQSLGIGTYTATITSTNPTTGQTQTITSMFTIGSASPTLTQGKTTSTPTIAPKTSTEEIPVTGIPLFSYIIINLGIIFIVIGISIPLLLVK